ncbi:protein EI24 homolog isoform X1 [Papaver somniferum]|uniref:protein EI24 homolog isoform X1 n=1 Tax=Papaver somniferum TaxID=3469 RepID=UPI000E700604|nr:protein EI24 homolog isoform X1 [Papaver somniferum]
MAESTNNDIRSKLKQALILYLEGFREACCLHRVIFFCFRSKKLSIRTAQCFILNGFIFLGSMFILKSLVIPTLEWILPNQCQQFGTQDSCSFGGILKFYSFLHRGLVQLFYMLWFYPLYVLCILLSNIWYTDIAKNAYAAVGRAEPSSKKELGDAQNKPAGVGGFMIGFGETVFSMLLLGFFFLEVYAVGYIPYVGKMLSFLLLSWMYAYYCFEYKWSLAEVSLEKRLDFFESNWAFFAGFGSPCVLPIFFYSRLVGSGVLAILFPLFVLTATGSEADQGINCQRKKWMGVGLGRLPIFYAADRLSMWVLSYFRSAPQGPTEEKEL